MRTACFLVASALLPAFCQAGVTIASASNLSEALPAVGRAFESATHIHPIFSFGSTAQLAQQIANGAPFDIFTAADTEHVDQLISKGLLLAGTRAVYATGILVLWLPPESKARISLIGELTSPSVRFIAVANPELAPYGRATVETLQKLGLWNKVQPKIVYAANIGAARQYGVSGNADAVFTARSLIVRDGGKSILVDPSLHAPITQVLGIVSASKNQREARRFADFLLSQKGRAILQTYGYR